MPGNPFVIYDGDSVIRLTGTITGAGGSVTPPVTLTGTDPAEVVLTLDAAPAQATSILEVRDSGGTLLLDIDQQGLLDTTAIAIQNPPDTGSGTGVTMDATGFVHITGHGMEFNDDGVHPPLSIRDTDDGSASYVQVERAGFGNLLTISPNIATDVGLLFFQNIAPVANLMEIWDNGFNTLLFAISKGGGVIFPTADPHVVGAWWDNAGTLTRSAG